MLRLADAPLVGDVGTIVEILTSPGVDDRYVVECVAPDGSTIWLVDFIPGELSPAGVINANALRTADIAT
jgi:hypothetical protein